MPSYAALLPMRALTVLGAAVFTPQAAAAIGVMTPPAEHAAARSPSSSSAGRWPRCSACRSRPGSARPSAGAAAFLAVAALGAVGARLGLARRARRRAARARSSLRGLARRRFAQPGADGDGRGHRARRRRASSRCSRTSRRTSSTSLGAEHRRGHGAVRLVRRLRPHRQRRCCRATSTASAPTRAVDLRARR